MLAITYRLNLAGLGGWLKVLAMFVLLVVAVLATAWVATAIIAHATAILAAVKATGVVVTTMAAVIKLPALLG